LLAAAVGAVGALLPISCPNEAIAARTCADGRFLVSSGLLANDDGTARIVVIRGNRIAIEGTCPAVGGKVRRSRKGVRVGVTWRRCDGLAGRTRLRALLDVECTALNGTLTVGKGRLRRKFAGIRSVCGDAFLDTTGGELCEDRVTAVALRFDRLALPPHAPILSAHVELHITDAGGGHGPLRIDGERSGNAAPLTASFRDLTSRLRTVAGVTWSPEERMDVATESDDEPTNGRTPDLTTVVQEIVDEPGWATGSALTLVVTGVGRRTIRAFDGNADEAPLLRVAYAAPPAPATNQQDAPARDETGSAGRDPVTVTRGVVAGADDAEQRAGGSIRLDSDDLELGEDSGPRLVGLRFIDVPLPPGATIVSAGLQFHASEPGSAPTLLYVEGQLADDAEAFRATDDDLGDRRRSVTRVAWSPPAWTDAGAAGAAQRSPDVAAVIQEIIDRPGWSSGNALALLVTGSGQRVADAFEKDPSRAPRLEVVYVATQGASTTTTVSMSTTTSTTTLPIGRTTIERRIASSTDDAAEMASGVVTLRGETLVLSGDSAPDCPADLRCTQRCGCVPDDGIPQISFAADVQPILTRRCTSPACHAGSTPQEGLDLRAETAHPALVGVRSRQCPDQLLVTPGAPAHSYAYAKLLGIGPCFAGARMPSTGRPLTDAEVTIIATWIAQGAAAE
jgi:hypothetical protein